MVVAVPIAAALRAASLPHRGAKGSIVVARSTSLHRAAYLTVGDVGLAHVAARQELREMIAGLAVPGQDEINQPKAAAAG